MELGTVKDAFERVVMKRKLNLSKYQELIDQISRETEQTLSEIKSNSDISGNMMKTILTDLGSKLHAIDPLKNLERAQKDLNTNLIEYSKLLGKVFNLEISKAYRKVGLDFHILNQIIVNHFYRDGLFEIGDNMIAETREPEANKLKSDSMEMHRILEALKVKSLEPAQKWVDTNREELKQWNSNLEFELHKLQYVEILWYGTRIDAFNYAKKFLVPFASSHRAEFEKLVCCLMWFQNLHVCPYREFLLSITWERLSEEVKREFCHSWFQSVKSPLSVAVAAGIEALPTLLKLVKVAAAKKLEWQEIEQLPGQVDLGNEFQFHSFFICPLCRELVSENPAILLSCSHVFCVNCVLEVSFDGCYRYVCRYCQAYAHAANGTAFDFVS